MGKSPWKSLKDLLFRKKSNSKKAGKVELSVGGEEPPCLVVSSQVISHPLPVSISNHEPEKGLAPNVTNNGTIMLHDNENSTKTHVSESETSNGREGKAAIKVQAVILGHEELRHLIKLQARTRGRLVRRQAVATLRCVYGIVKMQALVRGWKARSSGFSFDVVKHVDLSGVNMSRQKMSVPAFICKLLCSKPLALALQMQYAQEEPNSVWNWLERWTLTKFWRSNTKTMRSLEIKLGNIMEPESGNPKCTAQRRFLGGSDSITTYVIEHERSKQNMEEGVGSVADQKRPQSELEKVKCNLRMLSRASARVTSEAQKSRYSSGLVSSFKADVPERMVFDSAGVAKDVNSVPIAMINMQTVSKPDCEAKTNVDSALEPDEPGLDYTSNEDIFAEGLQAVQSSAEGKSNFLSLNDELNMTEDQSWNKTPKIGKNFSSSAKSEFLENSLLSPPMLPSYMAATESTKAKHRAQCSPRLSSNDTDNTELTRRHSLPSTLNGKLTSPSPRTHRLVQTNCKGGIRGDRSLTSSSDGNDKPNPVEWRQSGFINDLQT